MTTRRHFTAASLLATPLMMMGTGAAFGQPSEMPLGGRSEAEQIALEAYIYGYSLITTEVTRVQMSNVDKVEGLSFNLAVQGSGSAAIGNAEVDRLDVGISGAGSATIAGSAPELTAIIRGTSSLDAAQLAVKDATIGVEGPSQVRVTASNTAKVDARGVASVEVAGGAACTVKTQGSAIVTGC